MQQPNTLKAKKDQLAGRERKDRQPVPTVVEHGRKRQRPNTHIKRHQAEL